MKKLLNYKDEWLLNYLPFCIRNGFYNLIVKNGQNNVTVSFNSERLELEQHFNCKKNIRTILGLIEFKKLQQWLKL